MAEELLGKPTVKELFSKSSPEEIHQFLGGIYEHSPWVAQGLDLSPSATASFTTVSQVATAMKSIVDSADDSTKLALLRSHPDLCEKVSSMEDLTAESHQEQSNAGLQSLTPSELQRFTTLNEHYKAAFGFPFILAVRNATKHTVLQALAGRHRNTRETEFGQALTQVHKIAWMRLLQAFNTEDAEGFLTCHVLDTANGCGAENMRIELHKLADGGDTKEFVGEFITNQEGRLAGGPALKGGKEFVVGTYEWTFYTGDYFASKGTFVSGMPFLDVIPIRFGIDNPDEHYHVPLLVSPWSFSTYRGS